jgi:hypothetical protein
MATTSRIGIENKDGTVTSIHCHYDGHPISTGKDLVKTYNDRTKVEELLKLGDILYLDESIECPEGHSWLTPIKGYTVAYCRDKNEAFRFRTDDSVEEYLKSSKHYVYLFTLNDKWICVGSWEENQINLYPHKNIKEKIQK